MADGFSLSIDGSEAQEILEKALGRLENPRPLLKRIGIDLLFQTKDRFNKGIDPDGDPWAVLTEATQRQRRGDSSQILRDTGRLFQSLIYSVNADNVQIGTNLEYAPFHQFGTSRMVARPFLGVDSETEQDIIDVTIEYLSEVF